MDIQRDEMAALFQLLSRLEQELPVPLLMLKTRIEKELYTFMSIDDIEKLIEGGGISQHTNKGEKN